MGVGVEDGSNRHGLILPPSLSIGTVYIDPLNRRAIIGGWGFKKEILNLEKKFCNFSKHVANTPLGERELHLKNQYHVLRLGDTPACSCM